MRTAAALLAAAALAGCSTIQERTDQLARQVAGERGKSALDAFRRAEGASMGMVDVSGYVARTNYYDSAGASLTNGVVAVVTLERRVAIVEPQPFAAVPAQPAAPAPVQALGTNDVWFSPEPVP